MSHIAQVILGIGVSVLVLLFFDMWSRRRCVPPVEYGDMRFGDEPTNAGDMEAEYLRRWYEVNRESWWARHKPSSDRSGVHVDEFMLDLLNEVYLINAARRAEELKRGNSGL